MSPSEIEAFRKDFASIVYWKGMVKSQASKIGQLEAWNKGGSHDQAILNAIDILNSYRGRLKEKLRGKSYNEWKDFSNTISVLRNKKNRAVNDSTKRKWQQKLDEVKF